jgi:hypothetical protein
MVLKRLSKQRLIDAANSGHEKAAFERRRLGDGYD